MSAVKRLSTCQTAAITPRIYPITESIISSARFTTASRLSMAVASPTTMPARSTPLPFAPMKNSKSITAFATKCASTDLSPAPEVTRAEREISWSLTTKMKPLLTLL